MKFENNFPQVFKLLNHFKYNNSKLAIYIYIYISNLLFSHNIDYSNMAPTKLSPKEVKEAFELFFLVTAQLEKHSSSNRKIRKRMRMKPWKLLMVQHIDDSLRDWFESEQDTLLPMLSEKGRKTLTSNHIINLDVDEEAAWLKKEKEIQKQMNKHQQALVPTCSAKGRDVSSTQVSATPGIGHGFGVSPHKVTPPVSLSVNESVSRGRRTKQASPRRREPTGEKKPMKEEKKGHGFEVSPRMVTPPLSPPVKKSVSGGRRTKQANPRRREPTQEKKPDKFLIISAEGRVYVSQ